MELKDIFRYEERQLYPELANLQRRYLQLRGRFAAFVDSFPPPRGRFPAEVEFVPDVNQPLLTVRFCGKELWFRFDMVEGGACGQVRCLLPPLEGKKEPEELGRFTFNGEGITNITPPGKNADPLVIYVSESAHGIVASFLSAAYAAP